MLLGVVLTTYYFGLWLGRENVESRKKRILLLGVGINLALLVLMRYLPFAVENLRLLLRPLIGTVSVPMPRVLSSIGMSFYTFQALSYSNDIYREIQIPEAHLGRFALYVCFFPKLLQGPIERAGGLLIQLRKPFEFDYENTREGLLRIAWGLFKKVVIADRVAVIVNTVYGNAGGFTGLPLIVATYSYAIQIYTDFSGYTDIALGTARLFNIRLTENFNKPYFAQGVADFWRRWHISLSSWLLDYIFRPLQWRWRDLRLAGPFMALLVTFLVSGAWHGASWNFILWGLLHGLFIAAGESVDKYRK